jgi:hypothetical protein
VFKKWLVPSKKSPPQTIISLPVHTAVLPSRADGALVVLVAVQLSVLGLYLPPVFSSKMLLLNPPQTIISLPLHTPEGLSRAKGALLVLVGVQLSVLGLYLAPVSKLPPLLSVPPHMIISVPVHTAV